MEGFNEVSRAKLKIMQPHPGPLDDSSQLGDIMSNSGVEIFPINESLSQSPDKQSKQQYLFKQASLGIKQQNSKKVANSQKFTFYKSQSFMISQDEEKSTQQAETGLKIKSQTNLQDTPFNANDDGQEKHDSIDTGYFHKRNKQFQLSGPLFGVGQSEIKTHYSSNIHQQNSNQHILMNPPHLHNHGSSVSTFSFQQMLLPNQAGIYKNDSVISQQSPPARFGMNEELGSEIMKLQDNEEDSYIVPYPTYKISSEENNISNNNINRSLKDQSGNSNKSCQNTVAAVAQNPRFQLNNHQPENVNSNSFEQIQLTNINPKVTKCNNNEPNEEDISKSFGNNFMTSYQFNTEHSQGTLNQLTDLESKDFFQSNQKKQWNRNVSRIHVTEEDMVEVEKEEDDEEDNLEGMKGAKNDEEKKEINMSKKQSVSTSNCGQTGLRSQARSPQNKITSSSKSPLNYFSNLKNYVSKISKTDSENIPRLRSEIAGNSVSQRRDDFSTLQLMNMQSHLGAHSENSSNMRDKRKSMALNVIQALQKARQKHLERAKADKQEKINNRVHEFINILKMKTKLRSPSLIKKKILDIINDLVYTNRQNGSRLNGRNPSFRISRIKLPSYNILYSIYRKINIPILHPQSMFKLLWDFIHILIIILILIYIPIQMVTGQNMGDLIQCYDQWKVVVLFIFFYFIVDILISFNTGIYDQGIVNENRKDVALTYIKKAMVLDILFSISIMKTFYDMESDYEFSMVCCCILFLKIIELRKIVNNFTDILLSIRNNTKLYYLVELISLLGTILFVGHIFGCAFWKVAEQGNNDSSKTWMKKINIQNYPWQNKYLYSIYYSITTMITVGYGDITPQSSSEIIMAIVYMILSSAVFGYSLNTIGSIIKEIQRDTHYIKEQMSLVNRYLNDKNISRDLKVTIRMFLQYKLKSKNLISLEQEKYIQEELSTHLREKLISEENINIMRQCKSTFSHFSEECLQKLALRVKQIRVSKNEMIFEEGQLDDDPIFYFIQRGSIELYVESVKGDYNFTTLAILQEGNSLGETSIYRDQVKTVSAKAMEMSILRTLSRSEIMEVLRHFPKDYEKFCFFRDEILLNKKTNVVNQNCFNCRSDNHAINQCPSLHYLPDKEKIVLAHIYSEDQKRGQVKRCKEKSMNAIQNQASIKELKEIFVSRQKEEMMLLTWDSEENQNYLETNEQEESMVNQTNRISIHTANTHRQNTHNTQHNNNKSTISNQHSNNNIFNRSRNMKSGFHPNKPGNKNRGGQQNNNDNSSSSSSSSGSHSPSTNSSHSSSILSQSFVIFGKGKKSMAQQHNQHSNEQQHRQSSAPHQMQNSQAQSSNNYQRGLFKMTETIDNPIMKAEDETGENKRKSRYNSQENQEETNRVYFDQTTDEKQPQPQTIQFKRAESYVSKHPQAIMSSGVSSAGNVANEGSNNNSVFQGIQNLPPERIERGRQLSIANINKSQKPPQAPSSLFQNRSAQRAQSIKAVNNNQLGQGDSNINFLGNTLEVPKNMNLKLESGENNSLSHRSKHTAENDYNTGRSQTHQTSTNYTNPQNNCNNNNNSQLQNTAYFNNIESSQQKYIQKIQFDKTQDIPFYNTNEITEESSNNSKQSVANNFKPINRSSTKSQFKRQSNMNQSQIQQHHQINPGNGILNLANEDTEQINKNLKLLINLLQEKTPRKNNPDGFTNRQSHSSIQRKNTSITQPQSGASHAQTKQSNFSQFYQNYVNQSQLNGVSPLPPIAALQQQMSQQSQHYQDNNQVVLNGIQPQQFMRRRKHLDDMFMNYIIQQNEVPNLPSAPNIPLRKNTNNLQRHISSIHNSTAFIVNTSPVNHKQHQKNLIVQRQLDIQFSQKLAKFQNGPDITSNLNSGQKLEKQKYEEFIQKDVLQDQAREFTYYYPQHNLSTIIQNFTTMKVNLCNGFAKYTLYHNKNYNTLPYKQQTNEQNKLYQSEHMLF